MEAMLSEISKWWNVVFLVPIVLAALLLLLSAVTGLGEGADGTHEMHTDAASDTSGTHGEGGDNDSSHPLGDILRSVGVGGAVPISLLLQAFLLFFGVWGLCANRVLSVATSPEGRLWGALAIALVGATVAAAGLGALARRYLAADGPATAGKDLIARSGRVIFTVTDEGGTIQVRDAGGTLHQVAARVTAGTEPIEAGRAVLLIGQDQQTGAFTVEESPFSE